MAENITARGRYRYDKQPNTAAQKPQVPVPTRRASRPPQADVEPFDDEMTTQYQYSTPVRQRASQTAHRTGQPAQPQPTRTRQTEQPMRRTPITEDPRRQATRQQQSPPHSVVEMKMSRRQFLAGKVPPVVAVYGALALVGGSTAYLCGRSFLQTAIKDPQSQTSSRTKTVTLVTGLYNDSDAAPTIFHAFLFQGRIRLLVMPAGDVKHAELYETPDLTDVGYRGDPNTPVLDIQAHYDAHHQMTDIVLSAKGGPVTVWNTRETIQWTLTKTSKGFQPPAGPAIMQ